MFKKILCCVDGSKHGLRAARAGAEIAHRFEGELTLLTVAKEMKLTPEVRRYLEVEKLLGEPQYVLDEHTERIIDQARKAARKAGIAEVRTAVRTGNPARTIIDFAHNNRYDCIVLGSRGLGDIGGVLLGSVSHKVNSLSRCTVITVKE